MDLMEKIMVDRMNLTIIHLAEDRKEDDREEVLLEEIRQILISEDGRDDSNICQAIS